ncbi:MAG TPA: serine/threonine-protein kinase, partial [Gemmataceae bacterium]|nr:serine/threonine-protein kinase [Gemmataceae bacterium]
MAVTNTQAQALSDAERAQVETWLVEFERTWGEGRLADRVRELPPGPLRFPALVELVKIDLERSWDAGIRNPVESYLATFPELGTPDTAPADLLQAEWEVRRHHGEEPSLTAYADRFPGRADDLRRLLEGGTGSRTFAKLSTLRGTGGTPVPDTTRIEPDVVARLERQGRYRAVRKLGHGGMGSVYLVWDTRLDREVALKVPRFDDDGPELRERFYREARAASGLHHPNVCPVHDVGEIDGVPYLTMAYIEGEPLSRRLAAGAPVAAAEAAALVRRLARALEAAHQKGVVHRDLKPANVMIGADGEPVVMDFGLARRTGAGDVRLTQPGALLGTPAYMSPEQAAGDPASVGPASDVYSLGVMLYEMVTGRLPFTGTLSDILWKIRAEEPPRPSALRPDLDPQLEEIIMRAMAKKVEDRYGTMGALATALTEYLRQEEPRKGPVNRVAPHLAPPAAPHGRQSRRSPRWWRWAVAAALLGGVTVLLTVIVITYVKDGKPATTTIDADPGSTVRITGPDGKPLGAVNVPPTPPTSPAPAGASTTGGGRKPDRKPRDPVIIKRPDKRAVAATNITPDGKTVVVVVGDKVELWDADKSELRTTLDGPTGEKKSIAFSPDGRTMAVGGYRRVYVWDLTDTRKRLKEFKEPEADVTRLLFTAGGKRLLGVDNAGNAFLWDLGEGGDPKSAKLGNSGPLFNAGTFWWFPSPDRARVFVAMPTGWFIAPGQAEQTILDTADLKLDVLRTSAANTQPPLDADVSPDGKRVLIGEGDKVRYYDVDKGKAQPLRISHTKPISAVQWSPDGKLAASGSQDGTAVLWDVEANKERTTHEKFGGPVGVRFSPDGKTLFAWAVKGTVIRRFEVAGGKELTPL